MRSTKVATGEVHSASDRDRQFAAGAAAWLDRQLVGWNSVETVAFGQTIQ